MKAKKVIYNCIRILLILAILGVILWRANYVFRNKMYATTQDNFANYPKDTAEIVFIGTSHCFCSIDPNLIAEKYGKECFMLATSGQTVPESYYAAMEAIELQHPETIVMEVSYCANDFKTLDSGMTHMFLDGMPRCKARRLALYDLLEDDERIYYILNLGAFHSRWKELGEEDYKSDLNAYRGEFYSDDVMPNWEIPVVDASEKEDMPKQMEEYMDKIVALCRENNVKLVLFCAPFNTLYNDDDPAAKMGLERAQRVFNGLEDYASENDLTYHNLFHEIDELKEYGLDFNTDWKDSQHFNTSGMRKVTDYMMQKGYFD